MSRAQLTSTVEQNTGGAVSPYVAGKNKIINGDFGIWQRGTSIVSPTATNFYTADRWGANRAGDVAGLTVSRDTSAPTGFQYSGKFQRVSGNTSTAAPTVYYALESADSYRFAGQTVTLSFYAKAGANFTGTTVTPTLYYGTGTDQRVYAFTGITSVATSGLTVTTSWVRYSITGTVNAAATEIGFQISWNSVGTALADDSLYITGAQLELGSVATPFTTATGTLSGELAACQRYYYKWSGNGYAAIGVTNIYSTSASRFVYYMPVTMRATPTLTSSATSTWSYAASLTGAPGLDAGGPNAVGINFTHNTLTTGQSGYLQDAGSATANIQFSAEL